MQDARKLRLSKAAPDRTIDQKQQWMDKQIKPTFAQIWYAYGGPGSDYFAEFLQDGMERMTDAQWMQAESYRLQLERQRDLAKKKLEEKREIMLANNSFQAARGLLKREEQELAWMW